MAAAQGTDARAARLAERTAPAGSPRRSMLVIVNPHATMVSDRLRGLVLEALASRYAVEAVDTERQGDATRIARAAAGEGVEVVVAFGGDGTVNEAANGLAGSSTPLTALPGGSANVWARVLGIPNDVVEATERLLGLADAWQPRHVDLGRAGERLFVFTAGAGLDASVVERVDANPRRKARLGSWYYGAAAVGTFGRRYLVNPPRVRLSTDADSFDAVTVIAQNADPYTFFRTRPVRIAAGAGLETGTLALAALRTASPLQLTTLVPRLLSSRPGAVLAHRQVADAGRAARARVESLDGRPFPVQVDGDFIGAADELELAVEPAALLVVA